MLLKHVPKSPVIEVLHGVTVVDPLRWLEDPDSFETSEWIRYQKVRHDAYFSTIVELPSLESRVRRYLRREAFDQPARVGNKLFYRHRQADQEQASICIQEGGTERILFDPASRGIYASVAIQRISHRGKLLAAEVKHDGSDRKEVLIIEVDAGVVLEDRIPMGYGRGFVFTPSCDGYYYCQETVDQSSEHTIRRHLFARNGQPDEVIYRVPRTRDSALFVIGDDYRVGAVHRSTSDGSSKFSFSTCSMHSERASWKTVLANESGLCVPLLWAGRIFVLTDLGATNRRLIEISEDGETLRDIVPESSTLLRGFVLAGDRVYVQYLIDRRPMISAWSIHGERLEDVPLPSGGTLNPLSTLAPACESLFVAYESFTEPPRILEYTQNGVVSNPFGTSQERDSSSSIRIEEVIYQSFDGETIPMSIVRRDGGTNSRPAPLVLTGYGGFAFAMTPRFSVLVSVLLELGAVFALPSVRGGSEFGKQWHEAGRGRNRVVAIRNFVSAAEWLIASGITSADRLGSFGGSNSGLMVAAAMTMRPDLFRAVLSIAPLLDMVRFDQFDMARQWRNEYGSPEDGEDFKALLGYSPYHHIEEFRDYPATLFVTGHADDRCNPAHVRKTAALLQNRNAQSRPIIVDYSSQRGHCPVLPLSVRTEALARRLAFLCHELGIRVVQEANDELARA